MIVTIDGPAGTGKSTVAKQLAQVLGFEYLDTGAMYRMIAVLAVEEDLDLEDLSAISELAERAEIDFKEGAAILNGVDVSTKLRDPEVAVAASVVAQNTKVREKLVQRQRELAAERNIVCEGRDQGTVVFPQAEAKFYLTAASEVRAKRRLNELLEQGKEVLYEQLLEEQNERDQRDENRPVAPLKPAKDAVMIDSTELTIEEVVRDLEEIIQQRLVK
ncbi:MAG: (d)CMP kinase [Planctomicrobium sp.]|jgi:CMP/dCMP kinase|nr:(d)CMP kinase [Planctomicrobium sp.]